jgi:hypothetical protein|tara:strand:- start:1575 stop:2327 length:753 start_codon:yes stop_codon:yes gene_type:complete
MKTHSILQKRKVTALVIIFLIVSGILGGTYFYKIHHNETKSTTSDKIGNYTLYWEDYNGKITDDINFIYDGETFEVSYAWNSEELNGMEVYRVFSVFFYGESDEEVNPSGIGEEVMCELNPGENVWDIVNVQFSYNDFSKSDENNNAERMKFEKSFAQAYWEWPINNSDGWEDIEDDGGWTRVFELSNISETQISENLTVYEQPFGDYSMEIRVDIQTGGNDVCPHIEQGEEVGYDLHYQSRKLRIEPRD